MTTTKTAVLSSRVPMDVYLKVKQHAENTGTNMSDWLRPYMCAISDNPKCVATERGVTPSESETL